MAIADDEVLRLCARMWGSAKSANLACPKAGGDATWGEVIAVAEELIASTLSLHLRSPLQGKRAAALKEVYGDMATQDGSGS